MFVIIVVIVNLKGGVGKLMMILMFVDGLVYYYGVEVLVVDFDL